MRLPEALGVAPDGAVLVGDHASGQIAVYRGGRPTGRVLTADHTSCGRLGSVGGVAVAEAGDAYVVDADHHRVVVFGRDGEVRRCFGSLGQGRGQFHFGSSPSAASTAAGGIAVSEGHVYVADTRNHRVQRFDLDGREPKIIGAGRVLSPQGIAVRGARILVADDGHHRVVELNRDGQVQRETRFRLRFPYDVALASNGHAYVADNNGHRIVELDRSLARVRSWGRYGHGKGRLRYPRALAVGIGDNVLVADSANDRVVRYSKRGRTLDTFGVSGRRGAYLRAPADVAVNASGDVAVADGNGRIAWYALDGRPRGSWAQSRTFQQSTAVVAAPYSLAFLAPDQVAVADSGEVRVFAPGWVRGASLAPNTITGGAEQDHGFLPIVDLERDRSNTAWVLESRGRFARLGRDFRLGTLRGQILPSDHVATAIAALTDGRIAIAGAPRNGNTHARDGQILISDRDGRVLNTVTLPRHAGDLPPRPSGMAADDSGGLWISDAANDRVEHIAATGEVDRTLGTSRAVNGGALSQPQGIALACDGSLLVADRGHNRVVRYADVVANVGCRGRGLDPARVRPAPPVGLHVKRVTNSTRIQSVLVAVRATCARRCKLRATAFSPTPDVRLKSKVRGGLITVTAGPVARAQLRKALGRGGSRLSVGVLVRATASDGVVDAAGTHQDLRVAR